MNLDYTKTDPLLWFRSGHNLGAGTAVCSYHGQPDCGATRRRVDISTPTSGQGAGLGYRVLPKRIATTKC